MPKFVPGRKYCI